MKGLLLLKTNLFIIFYYLCFFVTYMHVLGWLQFYFLAGYRHGDRKSHYKQLKSKQKQLATYKYFFLLISN